MNSKKISVAILRDAIRRAETHEEKILLYISEDKNGRVVLNFNDAEICESCIVEILLDYCEKKLSGTLKRESVSLISPTHESN